jgi:hypothetical protein
MPKLLSSKAEESMWSHSAPASFPLSDAYGFAACTACRNHSYKARATLPALFAGPADEDLRAAAYMGDCRPLALR